MDWEIEKRKIWASTRSFLENSNNKNKRNGVESKSYWKFFERLLKLLIIFLRILNAYDKGQKKALDIKLNRIKLEYTNLPNEFNKYRILHLTDLHIDITDGVDEAIISKIKNIEYDICVMTGDFRKAEHGRFKSIIKPMKKLVENINAKDGIYATLGNHDTYLMVEELEKMGINVLINQTVDLERNSTKISFTGIDDVHSYFTDQAVYALEKEVDNFKVALVHSPEIYDIAEENNYSLYLCGHTHGGQICLPNGKPLITHLYNGKKFYNGLWQYKNLKGYTSTGCGTSGIPVRINSNSEIALFELTRI